MTTNDVSDTLLPVTGFDDTGLPAWQEIRRLVDDEAPNLSQHVRDELAGMLVWARHGKRLASRHPQPVNEPAEADEEAYRDAWGDFECDYLSNGEGHAPADTYKACRAAFNAVWSSGPEAAREAAKAEFHRLHPPIPAPERSEEEIEREMTLDVRQKIRTAFRSLLRDLPEIAPPEISGLFASVQMRDEFWAEGKRLQIEHGTDAVAPRMEQETAAGAWSFMRRGILAALNDAEVALDPPLHKEGGAVATLHVRTMGNFRSLDLELVEAGITANIENMPDGSYPLYAALSNPGEQG